MPSIGQIIHDQTKLGEPEPQAESTRATRPSYKDIISKLALNASGISRH